MRKNRPVIILLCFQLVFALLLAAYNPAKDLFIHTFGTEYTFAIENLAYYGNFADDMHLHCTIRSEIPDDFNHVLANGRYGIIESDENGLYYISESTDIKPDNERYIKSKGDGVFYFDTPYMVLDYETFELGENTDPPLFIRHNLTTSTEYEITASAHIFHGQIRLNKIFVDGIEITEFLTQSKERIK